MVKFKDIKGFIFDLDGVIADTSVYHAQAWRQLAEKLGVTWTDDLADALKGVSRMDSLNLILKAGDKVNAYTDAEKETFAAEKNTNYLTLLKGMDRSAILPGIADFLEDLKTKGYRLSLASASKNSPLVLEQLGLDHYFEARVDPATLKKGKPDPEIFSRGAAVLDLAPEACIGVEDAQAGVAAINAAGETSVAIGDANTLKAADIIFPDTKALTLANIEAKFQD